MSSNTFRCCLKFQYFSLSIVINRLVNAILVQSPRKKSLQNIAFDFAHTFPFCVCVYIVGKKHFFAKKTDI